MLCLYTEYSRQPSLKVSLQKTITSQLLDDLENLFMGLAIAIKSINERSFNVLTQPDVDRYMVEYVLMYDFFFFILLKIP